MTNKNAPGLPCPRATKWSVRDRKVVKSQLIGAGVRVCADSKKTVHCSLELTHRRRGTVKWEKTL